MLAASDRARYSGAMSTLTEIEAAADALRPDEKEKLIRFLAAGLQPTESQSRKARLVRRGDDALLEAPPGAPPMTPENVKQILQEWP